MFVAWTQRPTQPAFPTLTEPPSQTPHVEPEQEFPPVEPEQELPIGYVTAASLNVRDDPSKEHLDILKQGVDEWNKWRDENSEIRADLRGAHLDAGERLARGL